MSKTGRLDAVQLGGGAQVNVRGRGAIDCDVHANVPEIGALVPHLDDYWQDMVEVRGIEGFESRSYPPLAPLSCRPDWRTAAGRPAEDLATLRAQVLDRWQTRIAILNCLYGVQLIMDEHMAAVFAGAVNDWLVREWLDPEPRLRASIVVTPQNPARAVAEIERRAADPRFVQVLLPATGEMPLGRSTYWPIYEAASATTCRSASMPAAAIATRSPRSAGRPTTSRTTSRRPRAFRPSSRA